MFHLKENGTNVRTEIVAGLTSFMTMAYIVALNPNLLTNFASGTPLWNAVFMATCISSFVGTLCMAFFANKPFALAPGMGLNSFFAAVAANIAAMLGVSFTEGFQAGLVIMLVEGLLFCVLSVLRVREKIVNSIPLCIRLGISPALGLMLLNIGFGSNAGVFSETGETFYVMADFFGALTPSVAKDRMGGAYTEMLLVTVTMLAGLLVIILLGKKRIKGSVLYGILLSSCVYWAGEALFLHTNPFESLKNASFVPPIQDMLDVTFFKFNFANIVKIGWFTAITLVITFCIIDMFDTLGTFIGASSRAGLVDKDGNMPKMKEALLADAVATVVGACTGTSTVTTFVESASGVEAGGRTGLTAVTTAVLFLACVFIAPLVAIIPPAATSAALIYVGILMLMGLQKIDLSDIDQLVPVGVMLIAMPISGSIGHAIGLGIISYTVIQLLSGKAKNVSALTYVLSVLFLLKFFVVV